MARSKYFASMFVLTSCCYAGQILTFSEVPGIVPNGYVVQGVTLTWSNPASIAQFEYGATMGTAALNVTLLDDPVLQGAADGTLAIHFSSPVTALSFALALCCGVVGTAPLVDVAGGGSSPAPLTLIQPQQLISEGQYVYTGSPVTDVSVSFSEGAMFALDNLAFENTSAGSATAPEPGPAIMIGAGLLLVLSARRKIRRRPKANNRGVTGE